MRCEQRRQNRSPYLKLFQVKACRGDLLRVGRILQHVERFGVRRRFFIRIVFESEVLVSRLVGKQHAIVKCKFAAQVVTEHNMRQFMGQNGRQASFIRQGINESAADHDGISDTEGFERRSQHHAATYRAR